MHSDKRLPLNFTLAIETRRTAAVSNGGLTIFYETNDMKSHMPLIKRTQQKQNTFRATNCVPRYAGREETAKHIRTRHVGHNLAKDIEI